MSLLNNIVHFTEGNFNYLTKDTLPQHVKEQIILRQLLCSSCLRNGHCLVCKCKTPQMFYASTKVDSKSRWGPFLSEIQWDSLISNIGEYYRIINLILDERKSATKQPVSESGD